MELKMREGVLCVRRTPSRLSYVFNKAFFIELQLRTDSDVRWDGCASEQLLLKKVSIFTCSLKTGRGAQRFAKT